MVLICCTCHSQSSYLFVYFGFLFLQVSAVSNCRPNTRGWSGHLFILTCSVVLWVERDTANKYRWHMWGVVPVYGSHWVCPSSRWRVLPGPTLLRLQGALQGHCPKRTLHFVHFPGLSCLGSARAQTLLGVHFVPFSGPSNSGNQVLGERTVPGGLCVLITCSRLDARFAGCAVRAPSQVCCVSPLGSWS